MARRAAAETKKSERTRERILDAAALMFRRKGYAATTLNEIARLADLRAASIYYHFGSKDDIFLQVLDIGIDRIYDEVREAVAAAPDGADYRRKVHIAVEAHLATLLKHSDYTAANIINYGLAPEPIRRRHHDRREAYGDFWRRLLRDARRNGAIARNTDVSLLRLFLIGALNWSQEWYDADGKSIKRLANEICGFIFEGVEPD